MTKLGLILFSFYYWTVSFVWMALVVTTAAFLTFFFPYQKVHTWVTAPGFKLCIPLGFNSIKILYHPSFDPKERSVFCQNHVNFIDAHVAAAVVPHVVCGLMHSWQFHIPFYGWMMSLSKGIKVFPGKRNNLAIIAKQAKLRKDLGFSILTFPEGGRTRDGKVHRFRRGVFRMAQAAGYPIVPVAVKGMYPINRKGTLLFSPFHTIEVMVGPQMPTKNLNELELCKLVDEVESFVSDYVEAA